MRRATALPALAVAALVAALAAAPLAADVDPFYVDRDHDARAALAGGDAATAAHLFRIACFGMLDEPVELGGCLGRLAIAEARAEDSDGFAETWRRLATVEERFQGLAKSDLAPPERAELATAAGKLLPPPELVAIPAIAAAIGRQRDAELAALEPKERLRRLEELAAKQPAEPRFKLMLARAELDRGQPKAALERLKGLDAGDRRRDAATLRGIALARLDRCPEALSAFGAGNPAGSAEAAAADVGCLHDAGRDADARRFVAGLDPKLAASDPVAKALAALPAPKPDAAIAAAAAAPGADATPDPVVATPVAPALPAAPAPLSADDQARLAAARAAVASNASRAELERQIAQVQPIADARPGDADLQRLVATLSYRASDWRLCAASFAHSGPAAEDAPLLRFYRAVCLYESGDRAAAAAALGDAAAGLKRTPFVDHYLTLIAGGGGAK